MISLILIATVVVFTGIAITSCLSLTLNAPQWLDSLIGDRSWPLKKRLFWTGIVIVSADVFYYVLWEMANA